MNGRCAVASRRAHHRRARRRGGSILRLVMVLGLLATVTLLVAPSVTKTLDRMAREHEDRMLRSLAGGLKASIIRQRTIPAATGIAAALASELGVPVGEVHHNSRSRDRAFVLHPQLAEVLPLPYRQEWQGVETLDSGKTQLILVSCLSHDLPAEILDGPRLTEEEFQALWDAPSSVYPPAWPSERAWQDFQLQRVNLADLFVEVRLRDPGKGGRRAPFVLDQSCARRIPISESGFRSHYLKGSVLKLYDDNRGETILSITAVLGSPASFVLEGGHWSRERGHAGRSTADGEDQSSGVGLTTGAGAPGFHDD